MGCVIKGVNFTNDRGGRGRFFVTDKSEIMLTSITIANTMVREGAVPANLGYMFTNVTVINIRMRTTVAPNNKNSPEVCHGRVRYTFLANGVFMAAAAATPKTWRMVGKSIFRITRLMADIVCESSKRWVTCNISI